MRNSRLLSHPALPATVAEPRNNKQKIRNGFIAFLSNNDLNLCAVEIGSNGEAFTNAIIDTLRLIDGRHNVFKSRDHLIPFGSHFLLGITNHNHRSIGNVRGRTCHAHHSVSVLIRYLGAYKASTGSDLAGKSLNLMLYYLRLCC